MSNEGSGMGTLMRKLAKRFGIDEMMEDGDYETVEAAMGGIRKFLPKQKRARDPKVLLKHVIEILHEAPDEFITSYTDLQNSIGALTEEMFQQIYYNVHHNISTVSLTTIELIRDQLQEGVFYGRAIKERGFFGKKVDWWRRRRGTFVEQTEPFSKNQILKRLTQLLTQLGKVI